MLYYLIYNITTYIRIKMSKEIQLQLARKIQDLYDCQIVIDEEKEPHTLFCASDIGKILGIKNIRSSISYNYDKVIIKCKTKSRIQNKTFITYDGLRKVLCKCRKPLIFDFCNNLNLEMNTKIYTCVEVDTLKCIMDSFGGEEMISQ